MTKPVLAIDIDEVLFPFAAEFRQFCDGRDRVERSLEQLVDYDFDLWAGSAAESLELVHAFSRLDHRLVAPLDQARETLAELRGQYRLVIVTSRDSEFEARTVAWLEHHLPGLCDDVIMAGNRHTGRSYRSKLEVCRELGAALLVDDQLHYVQEVARQGVPAVLFGDYPWNQMAELPMGVRRARNWAEVRRLLAGERVHG